MQYHYVQWKINRWVNILDYKGERINYTRLDTFNCVETSINKNITPKYDPEKTVFMRVLHVCIRSGTNKGTITQPATLCAHVRARD